MKKVDTFFKDKLESHLLTPPENAWAKVESKLSKKNNVIAWRMAAAILIAGALIGVFIWSQKNDNTENPIAQTLVKKLENKIAAAPIEKKTPEEQKPNLKKKVLKKSIDQNKNQFIENEPARKIKPVEPQTEVNQKYIAKLSPEILSEEKKEKEQATVQPQVASTQRKPIKLEFTLDEVPSVETVATTNEAKDSGLKKVLNMARDMKQGEGLMNLREKKDNLFAHNFITGKTKNQ